MTTSSTSVDPKTNETKKKTSYNWTNLFTSLSIAIGGVFLWWGSWVVLDTYFFPNQKWIGVLLAIVFGCGLIVLGTHFAPVKQQMERLNATLTSLQDSVSKVEAHVSKP